MLDFKNRLQPTIDCNHSVKAACVLCNPHFFNPTREQSRQHAVNCLVKKMSEARRLYYKTGTSKLTDQEYDALEGTLTVLDPDNPLLSRVGTEE